LSSVNFQWIVSGVQPGFVLRDFSVYITTYYYVCICMLQDFYGLILSENK
jgi:hypothetical protein